MWYVYVHRESKEKYVFSAKSHARYQRLLGRKLVKTYEITEYATREEAEVAANYKVA